MKYCSDCGLYFEDSMDICSSCGERLDSVAAPSKKTEVKRQDVMNNAEPVNRVEEFPDFIRQFGRRMVINGLVKEVATQELLQSKFTKIVCAVFSGEPYQLSHTSTVTTLRVEEAPGRNGLVLEARDIMLYGSIQGMLVSGDDVTVEVVTRNRRLVAKRIYNHSVDSEVRTQPNIPAGIIRAFFAALVLCVLLLIYGLVTADYSAIGHAIGNAISSFIPTLALGGAAYYYVKKKFKR